MRLRACHGEVCRWGFDGVAKDLGGVSLLLTMGPMKQPKPTAAKRRPKVVAESPRECMLGRLLKRTYSQGPTYR